MAEYDYQRVERLEADLDKLVKGLTEEVAHFRRAEENAAKASRRAREIEGSDINATAYASVHANCAVTADRLEALLDSIRKEGGHGDSTR